MINYQVKTNKHQLRRVDCDNQPIMLGDRSVSHDSANDLLPHTNVTINNQLIKLVRRSRSHDSASDQLPDSHKWNSRNCDSYAEVTLARTSRMHDSANDASTNETDASTINH
jgi:hypothetical protein